MNERLPGSVEEAVGDLYRAIGPTLGTEPYALFGHSMGSLLAFELAYRIREASLPEPAVIFASGRSAPHLPSSRGVHRMSDAEFREELLSIGGTPAELFDSPSLSKLFLPIIRSDYRMIETYRYVQRPAPLRSDLVVLTGKHDRTTVGRMDEWGRHTTGRCEVFAYEGGHFFIHEKEEQVLERIASAMEQVTARGAGAS